MRLDRALAVNTFDAHRLVWLAGRDGGPAAQAAVDEALERAYFTEGENIADSRTLIAIAAAAGLDPDRVAAVLAGTTGAAQVRAGIDRAHRTGIRAVPTFIVDGRYAAAGARTEAEFTALLDNSSTEPTTTVACRRDTGCTG